MPTVVSSALRRRRILVIASGIVIAVLFIAATHWGGDRWKETIATLPATALLVSFALLPLTGFPVTLLLLAVGARFDFWTALAITAVATAVHLVASYPLAYLLRRPVTGLLAKAGWKMPAIEPRAAWPFSVWLCLAPGLSYALKNYTPPLAGIPFGVYFLSFFPIHMFTSLLGILLGGATMNFSWPLAFGVAAYAIVMGVLTKILASRLRKHGAAARAPGVSPATG